MPNSIADKTFATFPNHNNKKIVSELENAGAKLVKFPDFNAQPNFDADTLETINNLTHFDWLIFPDVLTVDFFLQTLQENNIDFFDLDAIRVCALGEAVSDRLRFAQLHADVIPTTIETETVLSALESYIGTNELNDLKFLLTKELNFENEIKNRLEIAGAQIRELPIYQIDFTPEDEIPKMKALLKGGAIDEFIFSAPTDFIALEYIFKNESLATVFSDIEVSALDGFIFQTAREHNLKHAGLFRSDKIDKVKR